MDVEVSCYFFIVTVILASMNARLCNLVINTTPGLVFSLLEFLSSPLNYVSFPPFPISLAKYLPQNIQLPLISVH